MRMPTHISTDGTEEDEDGWYHPRCQCDYYFGPVPDVETSMDVLIAHAYEAGQQEADGGDGKD